MKKIDPWFLFAYILIAIFIAVFWWGGYCAAFAQVITNQLQVYSPPPTPPPAPIYVAPAPVYSGGTYVENNNTITVIINNSNQQSQ
jgi:hypothetical protein